jgi:hypothetical protein
MADTVARANMGQYSLPGIDLWVANIFRMIEKVCSLTKISQQETGINNP